jgi:hypothetical protein
MIVLTCGHEVNDFAHAFDIMHKATDRQGSKAISYSTVCGACEDQYRQAGELFDSNEQAKAWLQQEGW